MRQSFLQPVKLVTKISSDISAIGYVSLGNLLNDSVVACKVDGVEATEENIEKRYLYRTASVYSNL